MSHMMGTCPRTHSLRGMQVLGHHLSLDDNVLLPQRLLFLLIKVHIQLVEGGKKKGGKCIKFLTSFQCLIFTILSETH